MIENSKSQEERLKSSEPVEKGWTNRVFETPEGTIIKVFSSHFLEALFFGLFDLSHRKLNIPLRGERLQKEIDVKKDLRRDGFEVPEIIEVYSNAIEMEKVEGADLREVLQDGSSEEVREIGYKTGKLFSGLHDAGYSLGDATFENIYLKGGNFCTLDHEYASSDSDFFDKERDFIHLLSDAMEHESYSAFREGFEEAYREFNRPELVLAASFSVFTSLLDVNISQVKETLVQLR